MWVYTNFIPEQARALPGTGLSAGVLVPVLAHRIETATVSELHPSAHFTVEPAETAYLACLGSGVMWEILPGLTFAGQVRHRSQELFNEDGNGAVVPLTVGFVAKIILALPHYQDAHAAVPR